MARMKYLVGFAQVSNCYGGPEEGGWYYEAGKPLGSFMVFFNQQKAYAYRDFLRESIEKGERFSGVGVGGCGDDDGMTLGETTHEGLEVEVQVYPASYKGGLKPWPEYRPRYE